MLKYHSLRDKVFSLKNLYAAFKHVKKNKGKAGLDRVSIKQFESNLDVNIMSIHQELKTAIYNPAPVLRYTSPKAGMTRDLLAFPLLRTDCTAGVQANHRANI
ncbi:MAG: hypothetical protein HS127_11270 [Planctomycetia bacterium]|nr:hypothetical protein [Planctomycetia bacterium]